MKKILLFFLFLIIPLVSAELASSEHYSLQQIALTSGEPTLNVQTSIQEPIVERQSDNQVGYLQKEETVVIAGFPFVGDIVLPVIGFPEKFELINYLWILLLLIILFLLYKKRKKIKEKALLLAKKTKEETSEKIETHLPV